jgi:phosphatidylglycerol:prolipoprotein diacylglycerol transferase
LTQLATNLAVIKIGIDPVIVRLGGLSIHWYGVMYVLGLALGLRLILIYGEARGISRDTAYEVFWPVLIASLIGGRLYYVVQSNFGYYLSHPQDVLATWEGGMAFYGAVFLGSLALWFFTWRKGILFALALDIATVLVPSAQAVGRIGNIINGDIHGYVSSLPWATEYTNPDNHFVQLFVPYDPAAAYELLLSALLFLVIWRLRFRFKVPGTLFAAWLVLYSVGQFLLFFRRDNVVVLLGLKQAQLTAIVVTLLAIPAYYLWRRHYLSLPTSAPEVADEGQPVPTHPEKSASSA